MRALCFDGSNREDVVKDVSSEISDQFKEETSMVYNRAVLVWFRLGHLNFVFKAYL